MPLMINGFPGAWRWRDKEVGPPRVGAGAAGRDAGFGHAFALATCSVCRVVSPDQPSPREFTTAPDFLSIAGTSGISDVALHEFLFGVHPTMPNMRLSEKQADDVIAFILQVRKVR